MCSGSSTKHTIGVVSGKGGVGKSIVTSLAAVSMNRKGKKVGILDSDITGPSIPRAFGLNENATSNGELIFPSVTEKGINVMSINLLLDSQTTPVIWRGPVLGGVIKQFWEEVLWGDLDYMFIDMPPGTGDVPLTIYQSIPLDGIIIVTTPQDLVQMIVEKSINMAQMMNIPILGIVENMSYVECPDCGKKIEIFGKSNIKEVCGRFGVPLLAQLPVDHELAVMCDNGTIESAEKDYLDEVTDRLMETLK